MMHAGFWLDGKEIWHSVNKYTESNDGMAFATTGNEAKTTIRKRNYMLQMWKNRTLLK